MNERELYLKLKPHIARDFRPATTITQIVSGGSGATSFSALSGTIANSQAPQFLLRDGSRSLTGSMAVDDGVTIDGIDISAHAANPNAHHNQQHSIISSDHTATGAAWQVVGLTATNTLGLLDSSSSPGGTEKLLRTAADGSVHVRTLLASLGGSSGGAIVQGLVDLETSYARAFFGHNAQYDASTNLWTLDPIGANDASGLLLRNSAAAIDFIFHGSTGNTARTMDHATFTGGTKFTMTSAGRLGILNTAPSYELDVTGAGRFTSTLNLTDGSVGTPALVFTSDTDTGLYRSGTDAFALVAGGTAIANVGATGVGINAAFDSTAALKVQSVANDDITLFLKQKSGQTARMWRVEDDAGQELIVLDSVGNLQSGNPGFVSGLTGWQITPVGNAEFNNAWIRGELHASIFVMDEFHASGGTLVVAPAGKLENNATVYTTTGVEAVFDIRTTSVSGSGSQFDIRTTSGSGSGSQFTLRTIENYFDITDPPSGHAMIFAMGDTIRAKALGTPGVGLSLYDIWGTVSRVEDMTDYYRYYYQRQSGGSNGIVIPAGTAVINYRQAGDGAILLTADQSYAPYIDIFTSGAQPWNGDITPHTRLGRLDGVGLPGVSGIEQYGMVTSTDLSDATAPYIVNSNLQMFSYNVDSEWNNGNPTARITSGGAFKLGTDIDNASTTGLDFNPTTGALTIGSASYPGTVTVYGSITVTGGNAAKTDFSNITATLDNVPNGATYARTTTNQVTGAGRAFTALSSSNNLVTSVIPATAIGNPGVAGLYLGSDYMGYHNGNGASTGWKTYMDSSGNMRLQGNSTTNYLQWAASSNKLQGVGGGVEQWYADATDGKLYAGGGLIGMDSSGLWLRMNANSVWATTNAITFRNASTFSTIDAVLSTQTITASRYLNLLIDPNSTPVGLEIIKSSTAQRVNVTHDLTVSRDLTMLNAGILDMAGGSIVDIGSAGTVSTWTPGITFGGGATGMTYTSRAGRYVKIGKLVYASCEIRLSNKGSSTGSAKITGLPVTAATTAAGGVPSIIWFQMATSFVHVSGGIDTGATTMTLVGYTAAAASYASLTHSDFANNSILQMTVMYEAA